MNVLILGGNGYLGSKVARSLIEHGDTILCTRRIDSDISRLEDICPQNNWILATESEIEAKMEEVSIDCVLNTCCDYGKHSILHEKELESNLFFPLRVLDMAAYHGVKNYVTIGTGLPDEFNMYSYSKRALADFGKYYALHNNCNFCNVLLEMYYGIDEPSNRFFPSLIIAMLNGQEVRTTIGTQRRDIICADDVVKAIINLMFEMPRGYSDIPIGTGIAPTISEVVDYIWEETGRKSQLKKGAVQMREHEPDCVADITAIQSICEWNPVSWKQGLRQMIKELDIKQQKTF